MNTTPYTWTPYRRLTQYTTCAYYNAQMKDVHSTSQRLLLQGMHGSDWGLILSAIVLGADPNMTPSTGRTPLGLEIGTPTYVKALYRLGADPNKPISQDGRTPLHKAVRIGDIHSIRVPLDSSCRVDTIDNHGDTVLHYLVTLHNHKPIANTICMPAEIVLMAHELMRYGANPQALNNDGLTPLQLALSAGDSVAADALRCAENSLAHGQPSNYTSQIQYNSTVSSSADKHR